MEGGAAAAAEFLMKTLIDVTKGEISLIRGLKKNADKLQNCLTLIHSYLDDAEQKLNTDEAIKTWLKQLEDVGFDAHNVLDELNYHYISTKMKKIRGGGCFPSFNGCCRRRSMALTINEIFIRFESIKDGATRLGLDSRPAIEYALPQETDSFTRDPSFIGRDNDVSSIVRQMLTTEETLSVLPIVGMGGLGKTTLTRKVFNDERIKTHFEKQLWIHVPRNFNIVILLKKILANLTATNVDEESTEVLLRKIRKELGEKPYLLVLDDVWNEDADLWKKFKDSLLGITSCNGNFILVTTRSKDVASIVHTLDILHLSILSNEDCWSIIKQNALSKEDFPSGFESIGNDIVERCQGLPLAANVVGGLLNRTSKDKWILVAQDWISNLNVDDNVISKILRFSFDHLSPPSLKRCFAYFSVFPKGKVINKQDLIELWMAQRFLQIDPQVGMEVLGSKFFDYLVQNSLLQVAKQDEYDNVTHCSMHDLVHDLACIVSKGIYRIQYIDSENGGDESSSIPKERGRALFFKAAVPSDTMFLDFKSLHTLTLMDYHVDELPSSINKLIHLRYLNVSRTEIEDLPDSIGDLYHLQTLRADNYDMRKLPSTVQYLINLRHLHLWSHTELPPNIGRLTCLQTLEYYHVGKKESHAIGELGKLKKLQGTLHILNLENVLHEKEAKSAYLFEKSKLSKLVFQWSSSHRTGEENDENVLKGLQPHPTLKMLEIARFQGTRFPSWMEGLNYLMEVSIKDCNECEEIPMMGHLPHLKSLSLSDLSNVKSIHSSFIASSSGEVIVVFPVLKRLSFSNMPKLVEWIERDSPSTAENHSLQVKVFPCLEDLVIQECRQLRNIAPYHNSGLPLPNIFGSLAQLYITGLDELEYLPDFSNNQNLSELRISNCGKLRELSNGLHTLNSLEVLRLHDCPGLKSIPYKSVGESQGLTSLYCLYIYDCSGLISLPCAMIEACASSLQFLTLWRLSNLINLPMIIQCLPKMPLLQSLHIQGVPKLVPTSSFSQHLKDLYIVPEPSDSTDSVKKAFDGMLQAAPATLKILKLSGTPDSDSLPDSLQRLKALSTLELENFITVQEFPEWFGNFTSLRKLVLYNCQELKRVDVLRGLKKLTEFSVQYCHPELKSSIEKHSDDVSHIPNIRVNYQHFRRDGQWLV